MYQKIKFHRHNSWEILWLKYNSETIGENMTNYAYKYLANTKQLYRGITRGGGCLKQPQSEAQLPSCAASLSHNYPPAPPPPILLPLHFEKSGYVSCNCSGQNCFVHPNCLKDLAVTSNSSMIWLWKAHIYSKKADKYL